MSQPATAEFFRTLRPAHLALIKPSALGDVVQTLPLLPVLRQRFPHSRITWIIQQELQDLVADHPCLDGWLPIPRRPDWSTVPTLWQQLRRLDCDVVLDLQGLLRSAVMTLATGARYRIGLETAREGASWSATHVIPDTTKAVPAHARYWRIAEQLGLGDAPRQAWVTVNHDDWQQASQQLADLPRPLIAVQWGAKWETKRWPIEGFGEVLRRAVQAWGAGVVIVGGNGERAECARLQSLIEAGGGSGMVRNLAGATSIKRLAAVLSQVDLLMGNDSGPLHLAAELGRPTLGVFTCTSSVRSGPPGDQHEFVSTQLACAASYKKTCPHTGSQHLGCHQELTANRVWQALCRLIEKHHLATTRLVETREPAAA